MLPLEILAKSGSITKMVLDNDIVAMKDIGTKWEGAKLTKAGKGQGVFDRIADVRRSCRAKLHSRCEGDTLNVQTL